MPQIELRNFQSKIEYNIKKEYDRGFRKILVRSPTGSGKTVIAGSIIKDYYYNSEETVVFAVSRIELVDQTSKTLDDFDVPHGIIKSGKPWNISKRIQIASIDTLINNFDIFDNFNVLILDEAHHTPAKTWEKLFNKYEDSFTLGFTATPLRLDGKSLEPYFETMVQGPTVKYLVDNGFLSNCNIDVIDLGLNFDTCRIGKNNREYSLVDLKHEFEQFPDLPEKILNYFFKRFPPSLIQGSQLEVTCPKTIAFCHDIASSIKLVDQFKSNGVKARHIDGSMSKGIREQIIQDFRSDKVDFLSNVDLFAEGLDVPDIDVTILLRPTRSLTLSLQQMGRGMRKSKQDLTILDFVGNTSRLGSPLENRDWNFDSEIHMVYSAKNYQNGIFTKLVSQLRRIKNCNSSNFIGSLDKNEMEKTYKILISCVKHKIVKLCKNPACKKIHNYSSVCSHCGFRYPGKKPQEMMIDLDEINKFNLAIKEFQLL